MSRRRPGVGRAGGPPAAPAQGLVLQLWSPPVGTLSLPAPPLHHPRCDRASDDRRTPLPSAPLTRISSGGRGLQAALRSTRAGPRVGAAPAGAGAAPEQGRGSGAFVAAGSAEGGDALERLQTEQPRQGGLGLDPGARSGQTDALVPATNLPVFCSWSRSLLAPLPASPDSCLSLKSPSGAPAPSGGETPV